jgi:quercetin dioxygenase-like cupin family protein
VSRDAGTEVVSLRALGDELLGQAAGSPAGRAARTVVGGDRLRATLLAIRAGAELAEHENPGAATLQVLRGRVRLHAGRREWTFGEQELVHIPDERHGLAAETDALLLLTVAS